MEFGYKAQTTDTDDGVVLDHTVEQGNPADAPQLAPAVKRVIARTDQSDDHDGWVRCRVLSFLDTQYYDDVRPSRTKLNDPSIALVATESC